MQEFSRSKRVKYSGKLRKWKIPGSVNLLIPSFAAKYINHSMCWKIKEHNGVLKYNLFG